TLLQNGDPMKTNVANLFTHLGGALAHNRSVAALIAGLAVLLVDRATAQIGGPGGAPLNGPAINFQGANPNAGLILSGNTLYGTAAAAGSSGAGTVFAVNTDGTGFRLLHIFTYTDGANPWSGLILSGNTLYGTAYSGGGSGWGLGTV